MIRRKVLLGNPRAGIYMKNLEAYRLLFPVTLVGGVLAIGIWMPVLAVQKGWITGGRILTGYPAQIHSEQVVGLFLLPALAGFIFTGFYRFTGRPAPAQRTVQIFLVSTLALFPLSYLENRLVFHILFTSLLIWLSIYSFQLQNQSAARTTHLWLVPAGLALGAIGAIMFVVSDLSDYKSYFRTGRAFLYYGMMPSLILGVGSRLIIPVVAGDNPHLRDKWKSHLDGMKVSQAGFFGGLFLLSFLLEAFSAIFMKREAPLVWTWSLRLVFFAWWLIQYFHILEWRSFRGAARVSILVSCYFMLAGILGGILSPDQSVHYAHLYFAGGIALFLLMIMIRMSLSHGGHSLEGEKKSPFIWTILFLMVVAALTRGTAQLFPAIYFSHLAYAALLFVISLILWAIKFLPGVLKIKSST